MFEGVPLDSANRKGGSKMAKTLPVSMAIHTAVIGIIVGASTWFIEDLPEPPIPVTFYAPVPPPPPPPPGVPKAPKAPQVQRPVPVQSSEMVQLTIIPNNIPMAPTQPELAATTGGVEDGGEGGVDDGLLRGIKGGDVGGTGGQQVIDKPLQPGGEVKAPVLQSRVEPIYPEAARKVHTEGIVILEAIITAGGMVEEVKVLKSVSPLLDVSAVRAVQQWRYKAATLNGRAVRVYLTVTVTFNLH